MIGHILNPQPFQKYDIGGAYHWKWYLVNYEGYRDFSNTLTQLIPNKGSLMDVGCGDGLISYLFFRLGFKVYGIDTSQTAIYLASTISKMALEKSMGENIEDVNETPFVHGDNKIHEKRIAQQELKFAIQSIYEIDQINTFDYAICSEVIEHLKYPDKLLKAVHNSIRKFAIITTPNGLLSDGNVDAPGPYDYHVWTPKTFAELCKDYKFEFLDIKPGTIAIKLYKNK